MADQSEPKKETVRITLPPRPAGQPAPPSTTGRDTVRINMPARPPGNGINVPRPPIGPGIPTNRPPTATAPLPPAPSKAVAPPPAFRKPPTPPSAGTSSAAPPMMPRPTAHLGPVASNAASAAGPKKETARIAILPDLPARPPGTVEMKKTQPLITAPESVAPAAPVMVNVAPSTTVETFASDLPMSFCWALFVASAAILIIQIWNYVS